MYCGAARCKVSQATGVESRAGFMSRPSRQLNSLSAPLICAATAAVHSLPPSQGINDSTAPDRCKSPTSTPVSELGKLQDHEALCPISFEALKKIEAAFELTRTVPQQSENKDLAQSTERDTALGHRDALNKSVPVCFIVNGLVVPEGGRAYITGGHQNFGCWEPTAGIRLKVQTQEMGRAVAQLPPGDHEFKVVVVSSDGALTWEGGDNRSVDIPTAAQTLTGFGVLGISGSFGTTGVTLVQARVRKTALHDHLRKASEHQRKLAERVDGIKGRMSNLRQGLDNSKLNVRDAAAKLEATHQSLAESVEQRLSKHAVATAAGRRTLARGTTAEAAPSNHLIRTVDTQLREPQYFQASRWTAQSSEHADSVDTLVPASAHQTQVAPSKALAREPSRASTPSIDTVSRLSPHTALKRTPLRYHSDHELPPSREVLTHHVTSQAERPVSSVSFVAAADHITTENAAKSRSPKAMLQKVHTLLQKGLKHLSPWHHKLSHQPAQAKKRVQSSAHDMLSFMERKWQGISHKPPSPPTPPPTVPSAPSTQTTTETHRPQEDTTTKVPTSHAVPDAQLVDQSSSSKATTSQTLTRAGVETAMLVHPTGIMPAALMLWFALQPILMTAELWQSLFDPLPERYRRDVLAGFTGAACALMVNSFLATLYT